MAGRIDWKSCIMLLTVIGGITNITGGITALWGANFPEDLENTLREYIDFFNQKRLHRKLKLQTPYQFEENHM